MPLREDRLEQSHFGGAVMDEKRTALFYTHQKNIERYESLLKTKLSEAETQYLERRLFEERFAMRILDYMSSRAPKGYELRE
jgi:hypothetical protein